MADRCGICRGSAFTDAIDSNGHPYRGCARCSVASPAKPRRWRKVGPHEYALRMGPIVVELHRATKAREDSSDRWWWRSAVAAPAAVAVTRPFMIDGNSYADGAPLAQCQADAITAVEAWRDSIR